MTENFNKYATFEELTNSSHKNLVEQNRVDAQQFLLAGKRLSKLVESIREVLGNAPISINSGFRNEALNKAVGSKAKASKHKVFEAVDITPNNMSVKDAFKKIMQAYKDGKLQDLRKVLEEGTWLHCEVKMNAKETTTFYTTTDGVNFTKVA
jgi:uncharacterized protein YcbK (DUF882 family)